MKAICFACVLSVTGVTCAAVEPTSFDRNVESYMKLRKDAIRGIPALNAKATPGEIESYKKGCASAIRDARTGAKQGDIITPDVQSKFSEIVRGELKADQSAKKAAKQGNPTVETPAVPVPIAVNAIYPDSASLSTVPPALLLRLPKLPKELDFRFVGRHFILRDAEANLILDFIPNAMP